MKIMRSSRANGFARKVFEDELIDIGGMLLRSISSNDHQLLTHLLNTERVLGQIQQRSPQTTCVAIFPIMKALFMDNIINHANVDVQVLVASCIDEFCRITAPKPPYPDDQMRVFFRLLMVAFQQLSNESDAHCDRALKMIETMAMVKSTWLILDIDTEGLIVQIFHIFLRSIRPNHSHDVFKHMETIMSMVIMESNKISFQLLKPLLDSVKKNKNASSISFELGEKVLQNCATKLQPYLKEAIKGMDLDFNDYDRAITSMLMDALNTENMMQERVAQFGSDKNRSESVGKTPLAKSKGKQKMGKPLTKPISAPQRKTSLKISPEKEGYWCPRSSKGKHPVELSPIRYRLTKRDFASSSKEERKTRKAYSFEENDYRKTINCGKRCLNNNLEDSSKSTEIDLDSDESIEKDKKKTQKRKRRPITYGEELVGATIQVWWPLDKTYYTGTVVDFYPQKSKHMILYDDDVIETLDLRKEEWKLISNEQLLRSKKA